MSNTYRDSFKRRQAEAKKKKAAKADAVANARNGVDGLLRRSLKDDAFTDAERRQISIAMRALDSVAGGFANLRRR